MKAKPSVNIQKSLLALAISSVSTVQANDIVVSGTNTDLTQIKDKTVLNIAEPSNGLSHNKFETFNVGQQGLVINNSPMFNDNLNGNAASIILNEVVGASTSSLEGNTSILGNSAEYILANPNGIHCNGCSFENIHTATLTTGTPFFDEENGTLKGFDVRSGEVHVQSNGLDYKSTNYFNIVSPSIKIDGKIAGSNTQATLRLLTGTDVRYQLGSPYLTGQSEMVAELNDKMAIDVGALGGMHANSIFLQAHAEGTGVRIAGNIIAQQDFEVAANKAFQQLQGSQIESDAIKIAAKETVQIDGILKAKQESSPASMSLEQILSGETISREGEVSLQAKKVAIGATGQVASNAEVIVKGYPSSELADLEVAGTIEGGKTIRFLTKNFKTLKGSSIKSDQDLKVSGHIDMQGEHNVKGIYDFQGFSNEDARLSIANAHNAKFKIADSYKSLELDNVSLTQSLVLDKNLIKTFVAKHINMLDHKLSVKAQELIKLIGNMDVGSIALESGNRIVFDGTQTSKEADGTYRTQDAYFKANTIALENNAHFNAKNTKIALRSSVHLTNSFNLLKLLQGEQSTLEAEGGLSVSGISTQNNLELIGRGVSFSGYNNFGGNFSVNSIGAITNNGTLSLGGSQALFSASSDIVNNGTVKGASTAITFKTPGDLYNKNEIHGYDITLNADDIFNKNARSTEASGGRYVWTMDTVFLQERRAKRWGDDVLLQDAQHRLIGRSGKNLSQIKAMAPASIAAHDDLTLNADFVDNDLGVLKARYLHANINRIRNTSYSNAYQISGYRQQKKFNSWSGASKKSYTKEYFNHAPQKDGSALSSVVNAGYILGSNKSAVNFSVQSTGFNPNDHKPNSHDRIQTRRIYDSNTVYPAVDVGDRYTLKTSATTRARDMINHGHRLNSRMKLVVDEIDSPLWSQIKPFSGT